jgi:hypothetical protein
LIDIEVITKPSLEYKNITDESIKDPVERQQVRQR